jgi:hypothetical protein
MGKKIILFKEETQMSGGLPNSGFANSLDSEKSLISANSLNPLNPENSPFATGRAGEREIRKFKSRITKLSEKMGKKFILFKKEICMREELGNPGFENFLDSEKSLISGNSLNPLNPLNPEKSLNSANSPIAAATGRAGEREILKSNSRITNLFEKMGKNFILFKKEIQMREELPILGFENSLNSEKSLISANSLNPLNSEKSPFAAATGRACPARAGGRGFRFRAEEKEIQKSKSRITKFPEKKSKNFILLKRKSA